MRIGFVINDLATEQHGYSTVRLAMSAHNRGHEAWIIGVADFAFDPDERVYARARRAPERKFKTTEAYLQEVKGSKAQQQRISVSDLDVLMLRNDPSEDYVKRPWGASAGYIFGQAATRHGVIVLNDPGGLARAINKMYFQLFPEQVRPKTLITRDRSEIKRFAKECGNQIVLKPLQGSGGQSVFLVREGEISNLNQMVEAVSRDGYVIAQEYLPAAAEGDVRLFVMNGHALRYKGKYAAFRRVRAEDDIRSNLHAGGSIRQAEVDDRMLRLVELVRPKLVQDGMFLVGLDVVGDKLMEINVFSPGGLGSAQKFEGVNFSLAVLDAIERKVQYMKDYGRNFANVQIATL